MEVVPCLRPGVAAGDFSRDRAEETRLLNRIATVLATGRFLCERHRGYWAPLQWKFFVEPARKVGLVLCLLWNRWGFLSGPGWTALLSRTELRCWRKEAGRCKVSHAQKHLLSCERTALVVKPAQRCNTCNLFCRFYLPGVKRCELFIRPSAQQSVPLHAIRNVPRTIKRPRHRCSTAGMRTPSCFGGEV